MKRISGATLVRIGVAVGLPVLVVAALVQGWGPSWWRPPVFGRFGWGFIGWGCVGFAAYCCASLCAVQRWKLLLSAQHATIPFRILLCSWFESVFIGFFFPSVLGRDLYRIGDSSRETRSVIRSAAVIVVEKGTGIIAFSLLSVLAAPVGFWVLGVSPAKLRSGVIVLALLAVSLVVLATLFRPMVIRVFVSLLPLPKKLDSVRNECADAMLAYHDRPALIARAIAWSVGVQLCSVGIFVALLMAFRLAVAPVLELFAVAPLLQASPILGFALVGQNIPDLVSERFFSVGYPAAAAAAVLAFAWVSTRALPGLIGAVVFALRAFSARRVPETQPKPPRVWLLSPEETSAHRRQLTNVLLAGIAGGLLAGAATGLLESTWLYHRWIAGAAELKMFWWGAIAYGLTFIALGAGVSGLLAFSYVCLGRYRHPGGTVALCFACSVAAAFVVIGRFRYARDVLGEHPLNTFQILCLLGIALLVFIALERLLSFLLMRTRLSRLRAAIVTLCIFAAAVGGGVLFDVSARVGPRPTAFKPPVAAQGPNVIFIVADTLRADFLPMYNESAVALTPALDRFTAEGVLFVKSYSQAPWTKPSFGTLFTGLYPEMHGATGKASVLPPEAVTLAEILSDNGYFTYGLPNNPNLLPEYGLLQGFIGYDVLVPDLSFGASLTTIHLALYQVLRRIELLLHAPSLWAEQFYRPAADVNDAVTAWLDGPGPPEDAPFFLYVHYMDPHDPYMVAGQPGTGYAVWIFGPPPDSDRFVDEMTRAYNDEIERVDRALEGLFEELKRRGLYEDALIVFTSDHGEELQEHGGWGHGMTLYEEVTHVPLIVKLPGGRLAGTVNHGIARQVDVAPTILSVAGIAVPGQMVGIPLIGADRAFPNVVTRHSLAQVDFGNAVAESIRTHDAKLIRAHKGNQDAKNIRAPRGTPRIPLELTPVEFYDLEIDPGELINRADANDPRQKQLAEALDEILETVANHSFP